MQTTATCLVALQLELGLLALSADCGHQAIKTARNPTELDLSSLINSWPGATAGLFLKAYPRIGLMYLSFLCLGVRSAHPSHGQRTCSLPRIFLGPLNHDRLLQGIGDTDDLHRIYSLLARPGEINGERRWKSASADSVGVREKFPIPEKTNSGHLASPVDSSEISALKQWARH